MAASVNYSALTSATAERAEDSSTIVLRSAKAATSAWVARLLRRRGTPRQATKAGIGFVALDNGFRSCEDPGGLAEICERLGAGDVEAFLRRWESELPSH